MTHHTTGTISPKHSVALLSSLLLMACSTPSTTLNVPHFRPLTVAASAPPPISGGTLLLTRNGSFAIASDPDRDAVHVVSLQQRTRTQTIELSPRDEPGRAAEDHNGLVHIVLRGGGAIVSIDPARNTSPVRRSICSSPRGIVFEPSTQLLHVACTDGTLHSFSPGATTDTRVVRLATDLRDVIVDGDELVVTTFRSAEIYRVERNGAVHGPSRLPEFDQQQERRVSSDRVIIPQHYAPSVAWRTIPRREGGAWILHQRAQTTPVTPVSVAVSANYYGTTSACLSCTCSVVHTTVSVVTKQYTNTGPIVPMATLPVDLAASSNGNQIAIVSPANATVPAYPSVLVFDQATMRNNPCIEQFQDVALPSGQPIAVAYTNTDQLIVQTREPSALFFPAENLTISLSSVSRHDTGHELFHSNSGAFIACASCHPEGTEDGRVWNFSATEQRRTQSLRGGITQTAPFHWSGDLPTLRSLTTRVFNSRMSGPWLSVDQVNALGQWLDRLEVPAPLRSTTDTAAQRGSTLFHSPRAGCTNCHNGSTFTNNETVLLRGEQLQVPSLRGVAWRAPYRFDGCATTLRGRFTTCGDEQHGGNANFTQQELDDLVSYLETL